MAKKTDNDLGFGVGNKSTRFINKDGSINVFRKGLPYFRPYDAYHALITMNWIKFIGLVTVSFFFTNLIFAFAYSYLDSNAISATAKTDDLRKFWDYFFFSVQTITTVGYGAMSPVSIAAKILSSIESFLGLLGFALITGLLYGRFSHPVAKIKYSENAIISPFQNGKALMFKMVNKRSSKLIEAEVDVVYSGNSEGKRIYQKLELQLAKINFFALSWTVVHPITEDSPLYNKTESDVIKEDAEIVILVKAFDDSFSQTVYSRMSYKFDELVWDVKFKSSLFNQNGKVGIDIDDLDEFEPA